MKRLLASALFLLAACSREDDGPVRVSVIGATPALVDPNRAPADPAERLLLAATAQGLVAFDEAGQIRPALAQRWIVTDDGLSAIFRLDRTTGPDGKPVSAEQVARRLRALLAPNGRNPLRGGFDAVEEITVMTGEVIEMRLRTPRPPLLELLAQPEAGIVWRDRGSGPFRIADRGKRSLTLVQPPDPAEEEPLPEPARTVILRGERAALAIARFQSGGSDLVLGGTFVDWPLVQVARPPARAIRIDPAEGLFGLSVVRAEGFLAEPENRRALAMAIDRAALLTRFGVGRWSLDIPVLPERYRSAAEPAEPGWAGLSPEDRSASARARVATWQAFNDDPAVVRIWLPEGPGGKLLFNALAADWRGIGVTAERVTDPRRADLRLVDEVAPAAGAIWYLATLACPSSSACSEEAEAALKLAREAPTLSERGQHLAAADRALTESALYIPIGRPLRWALVAPRLDLYRENARAIHPLDRLRRPRR